MKKLCIIFFTTVLFFIPKTHSAVANECVRIYYDASPDPDYQFGQTYALLLTNLLGHFPQFQTLVEPIENYRKGDIELCRASFYIGSYFDNPLSKAFLYDFANTHKSVVWMKHSIWQYGRERLKKIFGFKYSKITELDWNKRDSEGRPGFYKDILYKGETFSKYGEFKPGTYQKIFNAAFDMVALQKENNKSTVLAEAIQNVTKERLPYAIRSKNRFYIADIPFSFMNEKDRYLVFADLLFDILKVKPTYTGKKPALFRIEDVSSSIAHSQLQVLADTLQEYQVPFLVSLIPIFYDPLQKTRMTPVRREIPVYKDPRMVKAIEELKRKGATFVWHGVTHQYEKNRNPESGLSGEDFEFWDVTKEQPIKEDSSDYVLNKLDRAWSALHELDIHPKIWEVPHYKASLLDYYLFSHVFSWNIGRIMYAPHQVEGFEKNKLNPTLWFENSGIIGSNYRKQFFSNLKITHSGKVNGQFFPFEIYGDIYGQRLLPENLGYPPRDIDPVDSGPHTIDDIIEDVKRNRVLRDQWASLFFHIGYIINPKIGLKKVSQENLLKVRELLETIKSSDYEFIDVHQFIESKKQILRPAPVFKPLNALVKKEKEKLK